MRRPSLRCPTGPDITTFTAVVGPSTTSDGQHAPGLRFNDPRVMAVLAAIVGFRHLIAGFDNRVLASRVAALLDTPYTGRQATYDPRRLTHKGLIVRLQGHHRYQPTPLGRQVAVLFAKAYNRVLTPGRTRLADSIRKRSPLAWQPVDHTLAQFINDGLAA